MTIATRMHRRLIGVAAIALCLPLPTLAQTSPETDTGQTAEIDRLRAQVADLTAREQARLAQLELLEQRLRAIEARTAQMGRPIGDEDAATMRGAYIVPQRVMLSDEPALSFFRQQDGASPVPGTIAPSGPAAAGEPPTETAERQAPAPTQAVIDVSEQQQGRFGNRFGLELGLGYTHFDSARINLNGFLALDAIFLGTISIDQVTSDIFTLDPTIRFGVTDRLFLDASLPYLYRTSNFRSGGAGGSASALIEETVHDHGLGDLTVGVNYRLLAETARRPDVVLSARARIPTGRHPFGVEFVEVPGSEGNLEVPARLATGSGVFGGSVGLSALKTLDPLVIYGSVNYFRNFPREFDDINENAGEVPGTVDVGDAVQLGAGLAFALNDKSSISMSVTQRMVGRTRLRPEGQDERIVVGSQANVGLVNLGATFSLGPRLALVTNVGVGLTDDSPDMTVSVRLPYRF